MRYFLAKKPNSLGKRRKIFKKQNFLFLVYMPIKIYMVKIGGFIKWLNHALLLPYVALFAKTKITSLLRTRRLIRANSLLGSIALIATRRPYTKKRSKLEEI